MDENINESVETQEVAEPENEALESEETQEVAEPVEADDSNEEEAEEEEESSRTEADAAFAEMRREIARLKKENGMMSDALGNYFDGENAEELSINANAYARQVDPEEYRKEWEASQEVEQLKSDNESLEEELFSLRADKMMREDLAEIQKIDPTVESLDDLGDSFLAMRLDGGLSATDAFYACKAKELHEAVLAPDPIGKLADTKVERDYYTSEELDALSQEELMDDAVYEKAMRSLGRLQGKKQ
jgi:ribosomal protein L29